MADPLETYGNLTERNRRLLDTALALTEVEWDQWVKTGTIDPGV